MDNNETGHIDFDLIARFLNGETGEEEKLRLLEWLDESEENKVAFAEAKMLWIESRSNFFDGTEATVEVNTDQAWKNVHSRIQKQPESRSNETPVRKMWAMRSWVRIAAVLIVGFSLLFALYTNYSGTSQEVASSMDSEMEVTLTDGSSIVLNKESNLHYPKSFNGKERKVELEGEAFFDIAPDTTQPFIIETNDIEIKVLGTSFNVNAKHADSVEVFVETGVVEMIRNGQSIKLTPGKAGVFHKLTGLLTIRETKIISSQFWRNKMLNFNRTTLSDVVQTLNRLYEVNIRVDEAETGEKKINVKFEDQDIDIVLDVLSNTLELEVERTENGEIILSDGSDD